MLRLKKNEYFMIDEKKLNKDEAKTFIQLLILERERHFKAMREALNNLKESFEIHKQVKALFWYSSYKRHCQDIKMINKSINYLKRKFNLIKENKDNLENWM